MSTIADHAPDFVLAGAPKCATSSIAALLAAHPGVCFSVPKEPHFFCPDLAGMAEVASADAYAGLFAHGQDGQLRGEGSAFYLHSTEAAHRIHAANPRARILIALRDPAEAVVSYYHQMRDGFREDRPTFAEAWQAQEARARGEGLPAYCPAPAQLQYRAVYRFHDQVARFLEVFGPDAVHVILQEDLSADPGGTARGIAGFLGLDPGALPDEVPRANRRRAPRFPWLVQTIAAPPAALRPLVRPAKALLNRAGIRPSDVVMRRLSRPATPDEGDVPDGLRAELCDAFADDVARLSVLIDRDLSHWCRRP